MTTRNLWRLAAVLWLAWGGWQLPMQAQPSVPSGYTGSVIINEVAWAGHSGYTSDEWIELYNTTGTPIDLTGWRLYAGDGSPNLTLSGTIPPYGYYLIERDDDNTISDVPADLAVSFGAGLNNNGEVLTLADAQGTVIDTANANGGAWPAGSASPDYFSMERRDPALPDTDSAWASNNGVIRNGLSAGSTPINGTPRNRNSAATPAIDLALQHSGPGQAAPGSSLTYTIAWRNAGNLPASGVVLTQTLPGEITLISHTAPYPISHPQPGVWVWTIGALPISTTLSSFAVTVQTPVTLTGIVTSTVTISGAELEASPGNNSTSWTTALLTAPDLALSKHGPAQAAAGSLITYTLAFTNTGTAPASQVLLTDTLPAGISFVAQESAYPYTLVDERTIRWTIGTLAAGDAGTVRVMASSAATTEGERLNQARLSGSGLQREASWTTTFFIPTRPGDVVINEVAWMGTKANSSDEWIELYNATARAMDLTGWTLSDGGDIAITLQGSIPAGGFFLLERREAATSVPGDQFYSGTLSNSGESLTLRNAQGQVIDTANSAGGNWPAGNSTQYATMERVSPALADGPTAWATNDMVTRNGTDSAGNPINGTPKAQNSRYLPPLAELRLSKRGPATVAPGERITYTLTITNSGIVNAEQVRITDTLPAAVSFVTQTSNLAFAQTGQVLVWTAEALPSLSTEVITLIGEVALASTDPIITNTVSCSTSTPETNTDNNSASWSSYVGKPQVLLYGVFPQGYQLNQPDEAVALMNVGTAPVSLQGWSFCVAGGTTCKALPAGLTLLPSQKLWLTKDAAAFQASFGFAPDAVLSSWPTLADSGAEVVLKDEAGTVVDTLVYGQGNTGAPGWSGSAVQAYDAGRGKSNQIYARRLDEASGMPVPDTNTATDWMQASAPWSGRRVLYPGWDYEAFYMPARAEQTATLKVGIAPDNAYALVAELFQGAQESIVIESYSFTHPKLTALLAQKARAGVTVRLLLEGGPVGGLAPLTLTACQTIETAGGECWFMHHDPTNRIYNRYAYLHAKIALVDNRWALVSSQNFSPDGLPADNLQNGTAGSRGAVLITDAPVVLERLRAIFAADWDPQHHADIVRFGTPPYTPSGINFPAPQDPSTYTVRFPQPLVLTATTSSFEVLSAPESALRLSDGLLGLLARAGAGDELYLEQMYEYKAWPGNGDPLTDPNLRLQAALEAARRGARVRILLNGGTFGEEYIGDTNALSVAYLNATARAEGLDLQAWLGDPTVYGIHNKLVLAKIGGKGYVHLGSINGSEGSSKVNREVALNIQNDAAYAYLLRLWVSDWARSRPLYLPITLRQYAPPIPANYLLISEVYYHTNASGEWVELYNPTDYPIDLTQYWIGDAANATDYEGMYTFPAGATLAPHGVLVIAYDGSQVPQAQYEIFDNSTKPNLIKVATWGTGDWNLRNDGDQVILMKSNGSTVVDVVIWGDTSYPGVIAHPGVVYSHSLERYPANMDTNDCSKDFRDRYPPDPGRVQ